MKPLSPTEVKLTVPDFVIEVVNELLIKNKRTSVTYIIISTPEIIEGIKQRRTNITTSEIFKYKWLEIEDTYEAVGWKVSYHKPNYNEEGTAYFKFEVK